MNPIFEACETNLPRSLNTQTDLSNVDEPETVLPHYLHLVSVDHTVANTRSKLVALLIVIVLQNFYTWFIYIVIHLSPLYSNSNYKSLIVPTSVSNDMNKFQNIILSTNIQKKKRKKELNCYKKYETKNNQH